ncbi:MAG TPA: hypothetical protein VFW96_15180 [Thermomicrobiales bacterium]|nr:hypothetical protein [Thermomicrobiales bacterium]
MQRDEFAARCAGIIAGLPIPRPFDLERLRTNLEVALGRDLLFLPVQVQDHSFTGAVARAETAYAVLYKANTSAPHQLTIICHELGHIFLGHVIPAITKAELARLFCRRVDLGRAAEIAPLQRNLQRHTSAEERDAEAFGQQLVERILGDAGLADGRDDELIRRWLALGR